MDWTTGLTFDLKSSQRITFVHKAYTRKCKIAITHEIGCAKCLRKFEAIEMSLLLLV